MKNFSESVEHPSRYLGGEIGQIRKDPDSVDVRFGLAFPDVYEIGMSHQGSQILYHVLNQTPWISAERFYLPWLDLLDKMRAEKLPARTLESETPLADLDILGISLQYELSYTNVLAILDLAGLPFRSAKRDDPFPLVLGGGPCTVNPEPIAEFFDAILVGDGEEAVIEICEAVRRIRRSGGDKSELLAILAGIKGVYVPSFYQPKNDRDGIFQSMIVTPPAPEKVIRRIVTDLDAASYPDKPLVPYTETVHDRIALEIARGCSRGCRFCQAGLTYRPVRERSPERILKLLDDSLRATGHSEVSLLSLSSGDYCCIEPLVQAIIDRYKKRRISLSLPSLRIESVGEEMIRAIKETRKTGFTLAPEAGTEGLRRQLNKAISDAELIDLATTIYGAGWNLLKLYFMIGLPFETEQDRAAIAGLAQKVRSASKGGKRAGRLNVNVSTFVPKAHTPFQWVTQISSAEAKERLSMIRRLLGDQRIKMNSQSPEMSRIEGYFSRGDRQAADLVEAAYNNGCIFDGWNESFDPERWNQAAQKIGKDIDREIGRERRISDPLPWSHIDTLVTNDFLVQEYRRAAEGELTPDCRTEECSDCGVCEKDVQLKLSSEFAHSQPAQSAEEPSEAKCRFRLKYAKNKEARYLGHHELMRLFERAFRRAELKLAFSNGYHPHPRIMFGPPLGQGFESDGEYVDLILADDPGAAELIQRLANVFPLGLAPTEIRQTALKTPSLFVGIQAFRFQFTSTDLLDPGLHARQVEQFNRSESWPTQLVRKGRTKSVDLTRMVEEARIVDDRTFSLLISLGENGSVRPLEALTQIMDLEEKEARSWRIRKVATIFKKEDAVS